MFQETQTKFKLTWWPTPQDYNEAIQTNRANLQDPELQYGQVYTDALGLPRPVTGSFACVYRLHCMEKDFALRLFLRNISDQEQRYALISDFVQHDDLPYTVTFDFLRSGIRVMGEWLPALKMEWMDGPSLDDYIVENLANPDNLSNLCDKFVTMMDDLRHAGIAHGDLQHGNIILCSHELRLVDYDGMFVPAMDGFEANELGHRNYQHPGRSAKHFGSYLDNFSAWVIYASVKALQIDSRLLHQLGGGDDCLLFRQSDFLRPLQSPAFAAFEQHNSVELNALGRFLRLQLKHDPGCVPALSLPVPYVVDNQLEPLGQEVPILRGGPRLVRGTLPDWLEQNNATALSTAHGADRGTHPSSPATQTPVQQSLAAPANAPANPPENPPALSPTAAAHQSWTVPAKAPAAQWIKPPAPPSLPPELRINPKRNVKYYEPCGRLFQPRAWQMLMVLNPLVWSMVCFAYISFGLDYDLRVNGQEVSATIENVEYSIGKDTGYTYVIYSYQAGGKTYRCRESFPTEYKKTYEQGEHPLIRVLKSNPAFSEVLGATPGEKETKDTYVFLCFLALNLIIEAAIWLPAMKHRKLAEQGLAALARVTDCVTTPGWKGGLQHYVWLAYYHDQKVVKTRVAVSEKEFATITRGSVEAVLYDPVFVQSAVLYRFCRYHPVLSGSGGPTDPTAWAARHLRQPQQQPQQQQPQQQPPQQQQPQQQPPQQQQPQQQQPQQQPPQQQPPQQPQTVPTTSATPSLSTRLPPRVSLKHSLQIAGVLLLVGLSVLDNWRREQQFQNALNSIVPAGMPCQAGNQLVESFVKGSPNSPRVGELDEAEWRTVLSAVGPDHLMTYMVDFPNGRHKYDVEKIKDAGIDYLRLHPDTTAASWYYQCFANELIGDQAKEVGDILFNALEKKPPHDALSLPSPILRRLLDQPKITYSVAGVAGRFFQPQISRFCDTFHLPKPEVANNGLIRINGIWGQGSHVYKNPEWEKNKNEESERSETLKVEVGVWLDTEESWSASKTFETPADLQINWTHFDVPTEIQNATLNQLTKSALFADVDPSQFDYNKVLHLGFAPSSTQTGQ